MTAVGRHYGSEVSLYAIWNEPNHPVLAACRSGTRTTPASPRIYRALFQAGYAGLQDGGIAHPKVLIGETAPTGYDRNAPTGPAHESRRWTFLRGRCA